MNEEVVKKQAQEALAVAVRYDIHRQTEKWSDTIIEKAQRLYQPADKATYFQEAIRLVQGVVDEHRSTCPKGPGCPKEKKYEQVLFYLQQELDILPAPALRYHLTTSTASEIALAAGVVAPSIGHLHSTVRQSAGSLFATHHYAQAILAACMALDNTVQAMAQLPASTVGTALMTKAFSVNNPLIRLSADSSEQQGFMHLYQGSVQALRNHYAHNLTLIPAERALEWLTFISALFYKLDEVQPLSTPPTP